MIRYYVMPLGVTPNGTRRPKYFRDRRSDTDPTLIDAPYTIIPYGLIDACLVVADVTTTQHADLVANLDVAAAPQNIDQTISVSALPQVRAVLEVLCIPAGWVTTSHTYRQILRMAGGLFQFSERHHALHNEQLIDSQDQLDLQWNEIPLARRGRIRETANSLGYGYDWVTGTTTVRQMLKVLGDQWAGGPLLVFKGVIL